MDRAYSLLEIKSLDRARRTFSGIASTPELDRQGDSVDPSGCCFKNPLPLLWHHDQKQPIGLCTLTATPHGILFEASIPDVLEPGILKNRVDEAWHSIKAGVITGVSIGFRLLSNAVEHLATGGRRLLKTEIFELSLVTIPSNASATILTVKHLAHGMETASMSPTLPRLADLTAAATREQESLDFAKYLSCCANYRGQAGSAAELYLHRFNNSYGASLVRKSMTDGVLEMKAAVPAGSTTDATWAKPLIGVQQLTAGFAAVAHSQSLLGRIPGLQLVPVNTKIPFQTADANFVWMPESFSAPTSKLAFSDGITLPPTKTVGIVVLTAELVKLSAPGTDKAMRNCLIQGLNSFVDKQFLSTTAAVVGTNPAGLLNGLTPLTGTADVAASVKALIASFFTARPGAENPVLIANGAYAAAMRGQVPGFGVEVIASEAALSNIIMLDPDGVFYSDSGLEVMLSEQAMLEMADPATTPPTASTVFTSLWQANLVGYRLTRFISWGRAPSAVAFSTMP